MSIKGIKPNFSSFGTPVTDLHNKKDNKVENDIKEMELNFFKKEDISLNKNKKELKDIKIKENEKDESEEDPYDLDLQIKDLASINLSSPDETGGAQSEWPRCSRVCQTQRGHTCPACDTQDQRRPTCYRC